MNFSSIIFLAVFCPLLVLVYGIAAKLFRQNTTPLNILLCMASCAFYISEGMESMTVLLGLVIGNYLLGRIIRHKATKFVVGTGVIINVGILCYFKYPNMIIDALNTNDTLKVIFPLGMSFIIFQCISYIVEVYKNPQEKVGSEWREFLRVSTYLTFFPKIAQGPIIRYSEMKDAIDKREFNLENLSDGAERFLVGLAKKVLLADTLGSLVASMPKAGHIDAPTAWLGVLAFGLQLYLDFSGYSDMAIGLSRIFGFSFAENFNFPYSSTSVGEFWNRWHISLGNWFKHYIYIPLGGSRKGNVYVNLFIVFLVSGLWHGNTLIYLFWGIMHGLFVVLERTPIYKKCREKIPFSSFFGWLYTTVVVFIGWLCFRLSDISEFILYIRNMFGFGIGEIRFSYEYFFTARNIFVIAVSLLGIIIFSQKRVQDIYKKVKNKPLYALIKYLILLVLLYLSYITILSNGYAPFLYFRY